MSWRRSNTENGEGEVRGGRVGWGGEDITGCRLANIMSLKHISELMGTDKRSNNNKKKNSEVSVSRTPSIFFSLHLTRLGVWTIWWRFDCCDTEERWCRSLISLLENSGPVPSLERNLWVFNSSAWRTPWPFLVEPCRETLETRPLVWKAIGCLLNQWSVHSWIQNHTVIYPPVGTKSVRPTESVWGLTATLLRQITAQSNTYMEATLRSNR